MTRKKIHNTGTLSTHAQALLGKIRTDAIEFTQFVFGSAPPRLLVASIAATLESTRSLLHVKGILGNTLYIHTAICTVNKVLPLLSIYPLHLRISQLQ